MELILDRSEFFALTALAQARQVIGLDPATLLPGDIAERQKLYDQGERSLAARDLLRYNAENAVVLEATVRQWLMTMTSPERAAIIVRQTSEGRQLFLHYLKDGFCLEQTLPNETTHRWADLGPIDAALARMGLIFELPAASAGRSFTIDQTSLARMFASAAAGDADQALQALAGARASDPALARTLLNTLLASKVTGAISFLPGDGDPARVRELAFVTGAADAFALEPASDAGLATVHAVDAAAAAALMRQAWDAVA